MSRKPTHKKSRRKIQSADPPRIALTVLLPEPLAHGIIRIAAQERWSVSRVIAEALTEFFHMRHIG